MNIFVLWYRNPSMSKGQKMVEMSVLSQQHHQPPFAPTSDHHIVHFLKQVGESFKANEKV
jgi:hypothetical protein